MQNQVVWLVALIGLKKKLLGAFLFLGAVIVPAAMCAPHV